MGESLQATAAAASKSPSPVNPRRVRGIFCLRSGTRETLWPTDGVVVFARNDGPDQRAAFVDATLYETLPDSDRPLAARQHDYALCIDEHPS